MCERLLGILPTLFFANPHINLWFKYYFHELNNKTEPYN